MIILFCNITQYQSIIGFCRIFILLKIILIQRPCIGRIIGFQINLAKQKHRILMPFIDRFIQHFFCPVILFQIIKNTTLLVLLCYIFRSFLDRLFQISCPIRTTILSCIYQIDIQIILIPGVLLQRFLKIRSCLLLFLLLQIQFSSQKVCLSILILFNQPAINLHCLICLPPSLIGGRKIIIYIFLKCFILIIQFFQRFIKQYYRMLIILHLQICDALTAISLHLTSVFLRRNLELCKSFHIILLLQRFQTCIVCPGIHLVPAGTSHTHHTA